MSPSPSPSVSSDGPKPIRRLHETLINRIAAGEIIHRPASALKELLENALDAGSSSIRVTVKDGGMKLLQIQDNGCGIRKTDLPILAERFTTSKLSTFSDLSRLTTYGFRGEALASISHVSELSVITKTKDESCAWKTHYSDGKPVPSTLGQSSDPKPCAGNNGTIITIQNLFYNTPTRLSALRSHSEEYSRILDVITKYAVHNPAVGFICKKVGTGSPDLSTPSSSTIPQTIRMLYGNSIATDLLNAEITEQGLDEPGEDIEMEDGAEVDHKFKWSATAHFTNANYHAKKTVFLLFINHRLVDSPRIKRSLESVYSNILPKGTCPFIYLSLLLPPETVDVNVHPTKSEVHFLEEEAITEILASAVGKKLVQGSRSRVFAYQMLLTDGIPGVEPIKASKRTRSIKERDELDASDEEENPKSMDQDDTGSSSLNRPNKKAKIASQHKVRTSLKDRTLDSMFPLLDPSSQVYDLVHDDELSRSGMINDSQNVPSVPKPRQSKILIEESRCTLTSVHNLRGEVTKMKHKQLSEILEDHVFVGTVNVDRCLSLIQHSTKLYLVNHGALAEELFYQLALRQFGNFGRLRLEPPPPLRTLVSLAVDAEETVTKSSLTKSQIVDLIIDTLMPRRAMLKEYFSIGISDDGIVETLPILLRDYTPNLDKLPNFLMRIGPQVDWTSEKDCFNSFLKELAYFYVPGPLAISPTSTEKQQAEINVEKWQIEHILFPTIKRYLVAPKALLDRDVVQVASLPDLYRVFERC